MESQIPVKADANSQAARTWMSTTLTAIEDLKGVWVRDISKDG